jgi:small redox-active disulfide protein 2
MKDVKVLGTGCAKCRTTVALVEEVARQKGVEITLQKIEEPCEIISYGVMSTPAVVIDGKVLHAGGIPARDKVEQWLSP